MLRIRNSWFDVSEVYYIWLDDNYDTTHMKLYVYMRGDSDPAGMKYPKNEMEIVLEDVQKIIDAKNENKDN